MAGVARGAIATKPLSEACALDMSNNDWRWCCGTSAVLLALMLKDASNRADSVAAAGPDAGALCLEAAAAALMT